MNHRTSFTLALSLSMLLMSCAQERNSRKDAGAYFKDAQKALLDRKCWNAQELFRNLLSDFPGSRYVDDAQYGLGQAYFCSKQWTEAIFEYERLINEYPVSSFVDKARYQIGMCYFKQSRSIHHDQEETVRAIQEFTRFVEDYPNSDIAPEARKRIRDLEDKLASKSLMIAENYLKWRSPRASEIYCRELIRKYPGSESTIRARFLLARAMWRQSSYEEAVELLEALKEEKIPSELEDEIQHELRQLRKAQAEQAPMASPEGAPEQAVGHSKPSGR